jgi:hypothetical protein
MAALFAGKKFFVSARVPHKKEVVDLIQVEIRPYGEGSL